MGVDTRTFKDINGKAFGQELYDGYQKPEGQITEVSYMWVRRVQTCQQVLHDVPPEI
jgi:hypothetical protein